MRAVRLDTPLQLDGQLTEPVYQTVPPVTDFVQQEPNEGAPATEHTDVWVMFDSDHVYVSFRCLETDPTQMIVNEMRRDNFNVYQNDHVAFVIDTFYDRRNGVVFMVNPIGGFYDGQVTDERFSGIDWNPIWNVRTGRFDGGWTVEIQIPFKSIRFKPGRSQVWGLQLGRNIFWKNEATYLTPVPISGGPGESRISAAATLTGIEVPSGNRTLEIKPYDVSVEQFSAGGSYQAGTPDGSRPGTFYFNAYDLPSRLTTGNVTLYLHEGAPGHHFQISLARENEDLPAFMRFGGNTAYVEGWALYSETLGYEMGFFDDPWNRYGTLQDEQLRAMRLVVDTGLHAKGWTREQAIDFMLENSGMTRTEVVSEVERYIAIPSQALAYKVGALKIQELRKKAEEQLGDDFDIREFHAQVLDTGALPMPVLESKIDRWIASK